MSYRVPVLERFAWQDPVLAIMNSPAQSTKGSRYVVGASPSGDFAGHANEIAWHDGSTWQFDAPSEGWRVYNKNVQDYFTFKNSAWDSESTFEGLNLDGDVDSTDVEVDWDLMPNTSEALSFDSTSLAGIMRISTVEGSEAVSMAGDLVVDGDLTIQGTTTTINSQELTIEDKLITVNKGGPVDSGYNTGIEIEEDGTATGYMKVKDGARDRFVMKAPGGNILEVVTTADAALSIAGNLSVEAASAINQDVTTDADVNFNSVTANTLTANTSADLQAATVGTMTDKSTPANTVTVTQARTAYDRRAQWDEELGVIQFDFDNL